MKNLTFNKKYISQNKNAIEIVSDEELFKSSDKFLKRNVEVYKRLANKTYKHRTSFKTS